MKEYLIALILMLTSTGSLLAEVSNPATPGVTYSGTTDLEVMRMLIFSCYENCNSRYLESLYEDEVDKESIPEGGHLPSLWMPNGKKSRKNILYQGSRTKPELHLLEIKRGNGRSLHQG